MLCNFQHAFCQDTVIESAVVIQSVSVYTVSLSTSFHVKCSPEVSVFGCLAIGSSKIRRCGLVKGIVSLWRQNFKVLNVQGMPSVKHVLSAAAKLLNEQPY